MIPDTSGATMCIKRRHSVRGILDVISGSYGPLLIDDTQSRLHIPACRGNAQARSSMDSTQRAFRGLNVRVTPYPKKSL